MTAIHCLSSFAALVVLMLVAVSHLHFQSCRISVCAHTEMSNRLAQLEHQLVRSTQQPMQIAATATAGHKHAPAEQFQHRQKQAGTYGSRASPLDKHEVLDTVFSYVGIGDYFYTAAVCRLWRVRYLNLCYSEAEKRSKTKRTRSKCTTSYRSALMTASRLHLALKDTLTVEQLQASAQAFAENIVRYSLEPIPVLSLLKLHDLEWHTALCYAAAFYGKLKLIRWLLECGCQWHERTVLRNAIGIGYLDMLKWLQEATGPWPNGLKKPMLWIAGHRNYLNIVQWLYAQGTPWPIKLYSTAEYHNKPVNVCWTARVVKWALAKVFQRHGGRAVHMGTQQWLSLHMLMSAWHSSSHISDRY
jgi:Ankyrin repeats (many copies)